jgi:prepilin peptidase CpaA
MNWAAIALATVLLMSIGIGDWRSRKIPNKSILYLTITLCSLLFFFDLSVQVFSAGMCFLIGFVLWMSKVVGAGDIKLLTALSIIIEPKLLSSLLVVFAAAIVFTLLMMWLSDRFRKTNQLSRGVPMAVPISIAGFFGIVGTMY